MKQTDMVTSGQKLETERLHYLVHAEHLRVAGKIEEAVVLQYQAIGLDRTDPVAFLNLGVMQSDLGQTTAAIESYEQALLLKPDFKEALYNLGLELRKQGEHLTAIYCNQRVLELDPSQISALDNLCDSYIALKNYPALAQAALQSIKLDPNHANGYYHLGIACLEQGNLEAGRDFLERAAVLDPQNNNISNTLGLACLASGDLQRGWQGYERRWYKETVPVPMLQFPWPWWQGQRDRVVFVWREQGVGDEIMLSGMLGDLAACSKKVIFGCSRKLLPLMRRSFPMIEIFDMDDLAALKAVQDIIEVQCALGSLARWLRPDIASFPRAEYFLTPDSARVAYWRNRLRDLGPALNVGICWRSGNTAGDRHFHYTLLEQWQPVFALHGIRFINLQYGDCTAELESVRRNLGVTIHQFPEVDLFDDLDETAALTKALDLVISSPTTAGILAAALGVPVWMMISGFYWQQFGTGENCWYGRLVSIRRRWDQPWESIMEQLAARLDQYRSALI